ncbi:MAG: ATP-binding protein [Methylophilaceae bacterium]|nr:ATP-binding protein [Methylophilaceae bacterium]
MSLVQRKRALKHLLLLHDLIFVLLVVLAVAAGGYGLQQWHAASTESERINRISQEIQQTRGDLYRQMKELFDAQFLGDVAAQHEYDAYTRRIEAQFGRLESLAQGDDERSAITRTRAAYRQFLSETRPLLAARFPAQGQSLEKALNTDLELNIFRHYERVTTTAENLFSRKQRDIQTRLKQANRTAMIWLGIPVALAILLLILSRAALQRTIASPLAHVLRAAREISSGRLEKKVPETGAAELAELASTINRMADDLARSQQALLRSEKQAAQGALVPVLAHNIRNPLASIRATAQVSDHPALDAETRNALKDIIATVDRLERWTGSLLAYLHPLKPQPTSTTLDALLRGALAPLKPKLQERQIQILMHGCDALPIEVDVHLMEQALYNLLLNAIEASPQNSAIEISASADDDAIHLNIADRGCGMPFQPEFNALAPGPSTKRFGTGLGIPFAFKVCEAMGGELRFSAREGGGTVVTLTWQRSVVQRP